MLRLFVDSPTRGRVFLKEVAKNREELASRYGRKIVLINKERFSVMDVQAISTAGTTGIGAVLGGLIGLFGGPIGVIIGSALGGFIGHSADQADQARVKNFNGSFLRGAA